MIRVLVVEDSATMRYHLREALTEDPELEVVGEAVTGEQAVTLTGRLRPDVITMDMMLPGISGLQATEHIMAEHPTPILVVSSADRQELFSTYNALAAGAVDVMEKPRGDDSDADWAPRLRRTLRMVSRIRVITHPRARLDGRARAASPSLPPTPAATMPHPANAMTLIAVGASTGGPAALTELLRSLPPNFRPPVLCVQHIAASEQFAVAFSDWLAGQTGRNVRYATDGTPVRTLTGQVLLAPPDRHLYVRDHVLRLSDGPPRHSCRPSVDVLFESVATEYGNLAAGCLLTGMGRDGAAGLLQMRHRGAITFAQDEHSCTVYGMPREAALLGAAMHVLPPARIAARLAELQPVVIRR
ncbi:chemotaxis protein CheY [Actinoplanes sp. SE50]|uniref:chemotaxis-specific protein-glutamate methyltransferase CheB n=1 Tax=unclassified Actinoplanes TaxID=2626549 RepID=UPI00023ECD22|nr:MULTISPECIES: chemotaxis-specific protein-glutamate methyltransferase CheB [unclassified Actinoplanes]AEV86028.1 two-component system, chemotaxis family, response regulator CheB [Actinoplanes sp. SE50/110]ATO84426.1 chemotaxis protein CheY [Actinoplanes sp. SE50]SLM01836.1 chemotaxis response regulator protein-glutamate methylesterase [Actinoplanes sp. SE50/110]